MEQSATAATVPPEASALRRAARTMLLIVLAFGSVAAWRWRAFLDPLAIKAAIDGFPAAPLVFLAAHVIASLVFVPRAVLAAVAGLLFGMWWGLVWAALGSVLGAVAGFLVARYLDPGVSERLGWTRFGAMLGRMDRGGWRMVALVRLIPVMPHSLGNYALGLTRVSLFAYIFGSLLGQFPMTLAYVDFGAAGERLMRDGTGWLVPTLFGLSALGLSLLVPTLARRRARRAPAA
jgi:uncharacterized membrane protein YdjX (TVP38/TMEM64 family)